MLSKHSCHQATPQTPRVCPARFSSGSGQFDATELYTVENGNYFSLCLFFTVKELRFLLFGGKATQYLPQGNSGQVCVVNFYSHPSLRSEGFRWEISELGWVEASQGGFCQCTVSKQLF